MYVGGLLYRLILDNAFSYLESGLDTLGWFDANRSHAPVKMYPEPVENDETVEPNAICFSFEDIFEDDVEMGSNLSEHSLQLFIDIYGENRAVGLHLAGDVKDLLQGRFASVGFDKTHFPVHDLTDSNSPILFYCEIDNLQFNRSRFSTKPFEKYWWEISCDLVYTYGNDQD